MDKKKSIASKMYRGINAFISKHPRYSKSKVLSAVDRWSFRHSPEGKRFLADK